jgi:hypothetical protein
MRRAAQDLTQAVRLSSVPLFVPYLDGQRDAA